MRVMLPTASQACQVGAHGSVSAHPVCGTKAHLGRISSVNRPVHARGRLRTPFPSPRTWSVGVTSDLESASTRAWFHLSRRR